ncbi:hypothetical protein H105_06253 [Trichophyton soudanense CBS 452.61]|uniref:Uncharacterized protein n=1 Tax=Trichophyton soudanense CBS 452.61 TaxID=1215331 RepID=A0A022XLQ7_TRISD|nr:hypothetical protein H105_06253 [Trichophyton soudanense CBS 452.61]EZG03836.1 hypothetical protein H106_06077 [Trichophyton rubrum CBS 735.88]
MRLASFFSSFRSRPRVRGKYTLLLVVPFITPRFSPFASVDFVCTPCIIRKGALLFFYIFFPVLGFVLPFSCFSSSRKPRHLTLALINLTTHRQPNIHRSSNQTSAI